MADDLSFEVRQDNVVVARRGRCRRHAGDYLTMTLPRDHETNNASQNYDGCLRRAAIHQRAKAKLRMMVHPEARPQTSDSDQAVTAS